MKEEEANPWALRLKWVVLFGVGALAIYILGTLFHSFSHRLGYGFDLEWMEGGMLVHVDRLRNGEGLYTEPTADFIPYIYPPFYPWLLSVLGAPSYQVGRLVSIVGSLAAMWAAVAAVRQEKIGWPFALAPALLYATCYEDAGAFFDLVRSDALALGLAAWAIVLVRKGQGDAPLLGGVLLFFAFMAKHNYAALGLPMVLWLWRFYGRGQALRFLAVCAGPALAWVVYMHITTDGRFLTYLLGVPSVHPLVGSRFWPGSELELYGAMPIFVWAGAASVLLYKFRGHLPNKEAVTYWAGIGVVTFLLCALMRAHHGGFLNVLMPGFWMLAVLCCLVLGALAAKEKNLLTGFVLLALLGFQSRSALWPMDKYTPRPGDEAAGEELLEIIASYEGEVLMPHAPWYPALVGKKPSLPLIALWDIDHPKGPFRDGVKAFKDAVEAHRWEAIVTTGRPMRYGISKNYSLSRRLPMGTKQLRTRSGWPVSPRAVLEPNPMVHLAGFYREILLTGVMSKGGRVRQALGQNYSLSWCWPMEPKQVRARSGWPVSPAAISGPNPSE